MEDGHAVVKDLINRDVRVIECVDYAGCYVLQNAHGNLTSGRVQDVRKVILGKHAVSWVRGMGISPDFELVLC